MITMRVIRDGLMFLMGAGGFVHEVLTTGAERPQILLACLALMGVPVFLRKDEGKAAVVEQVVKAVVASQDDAEESE